MSNPRSLVTLTPGHGNMSLVTVVPPGTTHVIIIPLMMQKFS